MARQMPPTMPLFEVAADVQLDLFAEPEVRGAPRACSVGTAVRPRAVHDDRCPCSRRPLNARMGIDNLTNLVRG